MFNLRKFGMSGRFGHKTKNILYEGKTIVTVHPKKEHIHKCYDALPWFVKIQYKQFRRKMGI